jgi:hypothetical protein
VLHYYRIFRKLNRKDTSLKKKHQAGDPET